MERPTVAMARSGAARRLRRWWAPALLVALAALLAGCSSSGGGGNYSLGLAGSTEDHPSAPPTISVDPGGTYAFVYDNQIWLRKAGQSAPKQLTHMALSNGATILWGPLVWSPDRTKIAFTIVENLQPSAPTRSSGPLYWVDASSGSVNSAGGTGSVYGHSYAWFGNTMLFYSTGGGVLAFDLGDPDPRIWQALNPFTADDAGQTSYNGNNVVYGDIALTNNNLFYTKMTIQTVGGTGVIGSAQLKFIGLGGLTADQQYGPTELSQIFPLNGPYANGRVFADLGSVYTNPQGDELTGAWKIAESGSGVVYQRVDGVDTKKGVVTTGFCRSSTNYGGCDGALGGVNSYSVSAFPNLAVQGNLEHIAFSADGLTVDGGATVARLGWTAPAAWAGGKVAVTQLVGEAVDASDVTRYHTNVMLYDGKTSAMMIAGASNLAFA